MKHVAISRFLVVALGVLACSSAFSQIEQRTTVTKEELEEELTHLLELSSDYLVRQTKGNGMYVYRVNMDPAVRVTPKYNILRHSGTLYALCDYYRNNPNEDLKQAIFRAGEYLLNEAVAPANKDQSSLGVWSYTHVNRSGNPNTVKLGGNGLGLVALTSIESIEPGFVEPQILEGLGNFILDMQKKDGSFYSKFIPSEGGMNDQWNSLYYPGEAALGLTMLFEQNPKQIKYLQGAHDALAYLAKSRKRKTEVPADHWALIATSKILDIAENPSVDIDRQLLIDHAIQICEFILTEKVGKDFPKAFQNGFSQDGRITPTATRLEGLIACLSFLPGQSPIYHRVRNAVDEGILMLTQAVIREGEYRGGVPRALGRIRGNSPEIQQFNKRATEIRIDYVQHAMSALMGYLDL